jgi:hypothetical protein
MSAIFEAYNLPVDRMAAFYNRLNQVITYPDGMTTSLGIIYWGKDEHLEDIQRAIPRLIEKGLPRFYDVLLAIKTPKRSLQFSEQTGISKEILRILKHDVEVWLPEAVALDQMDWFQDHPDTLNRLSQMGLGDQLAVISTGQTPAQRKMIALQANLEAATVDEIVKYCDFYRTGKNLKHIRAKIYYDMGMDTWQKWAEEISEAIIARFADYIQEILLEGERLIPWPKEVRNGIEWAKLHLEIFSVQWW